MMSNMVDLKEYFQQKYQGRDSFLENIVFPILGKRTFQTSTTSRYSMSALK